MIWVYIRLISCTINLGNCASCTCVGSYESQSKAELVGNSINIFFGTVKANGDI